MHIAYISDLHLDFYVQMKAAWKRNTIAFLQSLLPETKADVLIIAGDLSHYNAQSALALQFFAEHFEQIFFVLGNHDYYLISKKQRTNYKDNSLQRELKIRQEIASIRNVTLLNNYEVISYKVIQFAGSTNWYSLQSSEEQAFFNTISNDSVLIKQFNIRDKHLIEITTYTKLDKVDILITHVPPIRINSHVNNGSTACNLNLLPTFKAAHHIFGHCHEQETYQQNNTTFYINALGYLDEQLPRKIRNDLRDCPKYFIQVKNIAIDGGCFFGGQLKCSITYNTRCNPSNLSCKGEINDDRNIKKTKRSRHIRFRSNVRR